MKRCLVALLLTSLAAGCAPSPAAIQPAYVSTKQYDRYTCPELEVEQARLDTDLFMTSASQSNTRFEDAIGVWHFLLPIASMQGLNVAPQIAMDKGSLNAVRDAIILRHCDFRQADSMPSNYIADPRGQ
jgi:hypothetical protein